MRNRSTVGLLAAAGLITALALAARPSAAGSTRKKVTCEEFRAEVESSTKGVGMPMVLKAGDWGKTPAALRALPPKASFCGSTGTSAAVASPLTQELELSGLFRREEGLNFGRQNDVAGDGHGVFAGGVKATRSNAASNPPTRHRLMTK